MTEIDKAGAIVEVRSGGDSAETMWARDLASSLGRWAERAGFRTLILDDYEAHGASLTVVHVQGEGAFGQFKALQGLHQKVVDGFSAGAIITVHPAFPEGEGVEISPKDTIIRAIHPGTSGQQLHPERFGMWAKHLPTGVEVKGRLIHRSIRHSRIAAWTMLRARVYSHLHGLQDVEGPPVIYDTDAGTVTDQRTGMETSIDGDMHEHFDKIIAARLIQLAKDE